MTTARQDDRRRQDRNPGSRSAFTLVEMLVVITIMLVMMGVTVAVINVSVEVYSGGYDEGAALERIERIYDNLKRVFEIAREEDISTREAAARLAERRLEQGRAE